VKRQFSTEAQILKRIDSAKALAQRELAEAEFEESQAKALWREAHELETKGDLSGAAIKRANGETHRGLSILAERSAKRVLNQLLPRLGRKLSIFRTDTLRFQEKEVKAWDHSIPV
jgi:hypothetical protein